MSVMHENFSELMREILSPLQGSNQNKVRPHGRLDGRCHGGNRRVAGRFRHNDSAWVVHKDTL